MYVWVLILILPVLGALILK